MVPPIPTFVPVAEINVVFVVVPSANVVDARRLTGPADAEIVIPPAVTISRVPLVLKKDDPVAVKV